MPHTLTTIAAQMWRLAALEGRAAHELKHGLAISVYVAGRARRVVFGRRNVWPNELEMRLASRACGIPADVKPTYRRPPEAPEPWRLIEYTW